MTDNHEDDPLSTPTTVGPTLTHASALREPVPLAGTSGIWGRGPPIALASCIQVDATATNALIREQSLDIHYNETTDVLDYLVDPAVFEFDAGTSTFRRTRARVNYPTLSPPDGSRLRVDLPASTTCIADTDVPTESAVSTAVDESSALVRTLESSHK